MFQNKNELFKKLNDIYKKFFNDLNFFSCSLLKFYIMFFSYENIFLNIINKTSLLNTLVVLYIKQIIFLKKFSFYFSYLNSFCYLKDFTFFNKENRFLKRHFLLNLNASNIRKKKISFFFTYKLFNFLPLCFNNISLNVLDITSSFLFLFYYYKIKKYFLFTFCNFIDSLFDAYLFSPIYYLHLLKKNHYIFYKIYNYINNSYLENNRNNYYFFTLKYISYFFDTKEFVDNRWERHFFTFNVNSFIYFFLKSYIKKKCFFIFHSLLLLLYL